MPFYILERDYFCSWVFGACLTLGLLLYISGVQAKSGLVPLYSLPYHFPGGYFGSSDSFGNKRLPDLSQPGFNPELTNLFPPPKSSPRLDHVRVCSPNPFNVYAVNLKPSAGTVCHAEAYSPNDRKLWQCFHRTGRQTVSIDLFLTQADDEASVSLAPNQAMTVHYAPSLSMETPKGMPGVNTGPEPLFELFRDDGVEMVENHLRQQSQLQEKVSKALQVTSSMMDTSFWQGMDDQAAQWNQSINFKIINGYYREEEEAAQKKPDEYRSGDWNIAAGLDDIILGPGASIQLPADIAFPGVISRLAGGGDEGKSSGLAQEGHGESSAESNAKGSAGTKNDEATNTGSSGESPTSSKRRRISVKNKKRPQTLDTYIKSTPYQELLYDAAKDGKLDVVKRLMAIGVNSNIRNKAGNTPLHGASWYDRVHVARVLLNYGADPELPGRFGFTSLQNAFLSGHIDVCKLLLAQGADPNCPIGPRTETILHMAARYGHLNDVIETLLENGANPNSPDRYQYTPLHLAAGCGHCSVVKILLANGADARLRTNKGQTALDYAEGAEVQKALRNFISSPRPLQHLSLVSIRIRLVECRAKGQSIKSAVRSLPLPSLMQLLILNPPYPEAD